MPKQNNLPELEKALTFYSDVLEEIRNRVNNNKDLLEAQEHLVYSIQKIKKVIQDMKKTLDRGE
jgi:gas vesicle protein